MPPVSYTHLHGDHGSAPGPEAGGAPFGQNGAGRGSRGGQQGQGGFKSRQGSQGSAADRAEADLLRRVPPHSVESEQAVLGGVLMRPQLMHAIVDQLAAEEDVYKRQVCMLALSLCNAARGGKVRAALLALCLIGAVMNGMYGSWQEGRGGVRLVESPYNSIRVYEGMDWGEGGRAVRLMATDPGYSQSGMYLDDPAELYFQYTRFYALGPRFVPQARSVLMLGGGGYSVPKWIRCV